MTTCIIFIYAFRYCINSVLLTIHIILISDSDDGSPEEFTNVYKLSREEYFWNMYNSSSFSECWEILKEGVMNRQTDKETGRILTQHVLKHHIFYLFDAMHFFNDYVLLLFFTVWQFFNTTGYNNSLCCIQCTA